jgi:hypothetical protein
VAKYLHLHPWQLQQNQQVISKDIVEDIKWTVNTKKEKHFLKIKSKQLNEELRDQLKIFIASNTNNKFNIIQPEYIGEDEYTFPHKFKKNKSYNIALYIDGTTLSTYTIQNKNDQNVTIYPSTILTNKKLNYTISLLFQPLSPKIKEKLSFQFTKFKARKHQFSNQYLYIMNTDGSNFQQLSGPDSNKSKVTFNYQFPKVGTYKVWYLFTLNGKNEKLSYILNVDEIEKKKE